MSEQILEQREREHQALSEMAESLPDEQARLRFAYRLLFDEETLSRLESQNYDDLQQMADVMERKRNQCHKLQRIVWNATSPYKGTLKPAHKEHWRLRKKRILKRLEDRAASVDNDVILYVMIRRMIVK